jgi:hypothetical protein
MWSSSNILYIAVVIFRVNMRMETSTCTETLEQLQHMIQLNPQKKSYRYLSIHKLNKLTHHKHATVFINYSK